MEVNFKLLNLEVLIFFDYVVRIEGWSLILLSTGLLGIRFYFSDFLKNNEKYRQSHIVFLMCFSVFIAEILMILYGFYIFVYHDAAGFVELLPDYVLYFMAVPKIIFYATLCYFIFWVLKMIQGTQSYVAEMREHYESDEESE